MKRLAERLRFAPREGGAPPAPLHVATLFVLALIVRLAVVVWASGRFPPTADGTYYHTLATRLASGDGYTWLWPDGVVTNVAHYPVGYPLFLAAGYALFGAKASVAMAMNAFVSAATAPFAYVLARPFGARRASVAGLLVALHPALVPYTAALMTEGVAATLVLGAAALAESLRGGRDGGMRDGDEGAASSRRRWRELVTLVALGVVLGVATLVRPQSIVLAPALGLVAARPGTRWIGRVGRALLVAVLAVGVCLPWTARNCVQMHTCALVSVNGGWNLLIGAQTTTGSYAPLDVPKACETVWDEAEKDACFGREARAAIASAPVAWLRRAPQKLAVTFDYVGAAPWYLHAANPEAFGARAKLALGAAETLAVRLLLVAAIAALAQRPGKRRRLRLALAVVAALFAVTEHAWPAYLALPLLALLAGARELRQAPVAVSALAMVVLATAGLHTVFFGAGRYALLVLPFVAVAACALRKGGVDGYGAGVDAVQAIAGTPRPRGAREESPSSTERDAR